MKVRLTFTEPVLGTKSGNPELVESYQTDKLGLKPDEKPILNNYPSMEDVEDNVQVGSTFFWRDAEGNYLLWDYQFKGFFKEACLTMIISDTMTQKELKEILCTKYTYKRSIDNLVFVNPRKIIINFPDDKPTSSFMQRPMRVDTMRGERVCLARSEEIPAGCWVDIEIMCLNPKLEPFIERWLEYGALKGMGQWRNGSYGRFSWTKID